MKRLTLCLLAALVLHGSASAQQYFRKWIDFSDSLNRPFLHIDEPLGTILLHGYLTGQLKAYQFDIKSEDVKWKPVPAEDVPAEWDPKLDYYMLDRVTYQGKYYETYYDMASKGEPPLKNQAWTPLELHGDVVSTLNSFPTAADTTTRAYLLSHFVSYAEEVMADEWVSTSEYYLNDITTYGNTLYVALTYSKGKRPDLETVHWRRANAQLSFYQPRDLSKVAVLYSREQSNGVEKMTPQMLSAYFMDNMTAVWRSPGLHFYYQDVVDFLSQLQAQPLLYGTDLGYVGTKVMLIKFNPSELVMLIQKNLDGPLKPTKKNIADASEYSLLLKATPEEIGLRKFWVTQHMATSDVLVWTSWSTHRMVLRIPWKSMGKVLKSTAAQPQMWTYPEALELDRLHSTVDTLSIDTLEAKTYTSRTLSPAHTKSFLESGSARIADNPAMAKPASELWMKLSDAVVKGEVQLQRGTLQLFSCDFPFPETRFELYGVNFVFDSAFSLEPADSMDTIILTDKMSRMMSTDYPMLSVSVIYDRQLTDENSSPVFTPVRLGFGFKSLDIGSLNHYSFLWEDVIRVSKGNENLRKLIDDVKAARLNYSSSYVVYGLRVKR